MIYVSLISYTPDPERTHAAAAPISTSSVGTAEPMKKPALQIANHLFNQMLDSVHSSMLASPSPSPGVAGGAGR
jgi:hypothetical protein